MSLSYYQATAIIEMAKARTSADIELEFRMPLVIAHIPSFGTYEGLAVDLAEAVENAKTPAEFAQAVESLHYVNNPL